MEATLKMKDLEALTGVSREAIHFYLREGLLPQPEKPRRNVAFYSDEHVVRINAIKTLQQERSLPLQTIKQILADFDYDMLAANDNLSRFELAVQLHVHGDLPGQELSVAAVTKRTGVSEAFLRQADELGVIAIFERDGQQLLDFRDVGIIETWSRFLGMGYESQPEYDAYYLKQLGDAVKALADAEVALFLRSFGDQPSGQAAELAAQGIGLTNELISRLRIQALMRALHKRVTSP